MSQADSPSRDDRVNEAIAAYLEAVERGENPDREKFIADNPEIASELRSFLGNAVQFLQLAGALSDSPLQADAKSDSPAKAGTPTPGTPSDPNQPTMMFPQRGVPSSRNILRYFGDYELIQEIARGGMGVVFKARQVTLNRIVAVKMILGGQLAGPEEVQRFNTEAEAAAQLDHPGIVPIYEVGEQDGQHYFSMGFVEGQSLAKRVAEGPLEPREAAEMVKTVSEAVQYAHDKGVIHRDLKPGNILLDKQGRPRVTDFGLAKLTESGSDLTGTGQILGTPSYMPPEQAAAQVSAVGRLSDVYSLGAILYCLLTGRPPFQAANPLETLFQVQRQEPVSPRQLNPTIPQDLDTIVLKCLDKSPSRRYASAKALAEELNRYLEGRPIEARPVGRIERFWRWCKREPVVASLSFGVFVALVVGTTVSVYFAIQERKRADSEAILSKANGELAIEKGTLAEKNGMLATRNQNLFESEREAKEEERKAKEKAVEAALKEEQERIKAERQLRIAKAEQWAALSHVKQADSPELSLLLAVESSRITQGDDEALRPSCHQALLDSLWHIGGRPLREHRGTITSAEISPDGRWVVMGRDDNTARAWDLTAKNPDTSPHVLSGHLGPIRSVAISPDSRWVVTGSEDSSARVWNLAVTDPSKNPQILTGHQKAVNCVAISSNGRWIVTGSLDATARVWDLTSENPTANPLVLSGHSHFMTSVMFSPDSRWVITNSSDKSARAWDLSATNPSANPLIMSGHQYYQSNRIGQPFWAEPITGIAISPDSRFVVTRSTGDSIVRVWDLKAEKPNDNPRLLSGHTGPVTSAVISSDSKKVVTTCFDRTARIWDLTTENPITNHRILRGHSSTVTCVAISPDNQWVVTGSLDQTVRVWDLTAEDPAANHRILTGHQNSIGTVAISSDSRWIVTGSQDRTARIWKLKPEPPIVKPRVLSGHDEAINRLLISRDNRWIVTVSGNKAARAWELQSENSTVNPRFLRGDSMHEVVISPDSRWAAKGSYRGTTQLWDLESEDPAGNVQTLTGDKGSITGVAFSSDSKSVVTASNGNEVRVWDLTCRNPSDDPRILSGHSRYVSAVAFNSDGRFVVSGSSDKSARVWDLTAANPSANPRLLIGHSKGVSSVAISRDDRWVVTGSQDSSVRVWDLAADNPAGNPWILQGHSYPIKSVAISPNGRWVATQSSDLLRIWDLTAKNPATASIRLGASGLSNAAISPDGRWVIAGAPNNAATVWDLMASKPAASPRVLIGHSNYVKSVAISSDSRWVVTGSDDNTVRVWDLASGDPSANPIVLSGYQDPINHVAISPNDRWIVATSTDGMVQVWLWQRDDLLALAGAVGRNLDRREWQRLFPNEPYRKTFPNLPVPSDQHTNVADIAIAAKPGQFEPVTDEQLASKVPKSFAFELRTIDAEPGMRFWTRTDDTSFLERYPSGKTNDLKILGRTSVAGINGTMVEKVGFESLQVFVPDRGSKNLEIKFRFVEKPDQWMVLGTLEKIE